MTKEMPTNSASKGFSEEVSVSIDIMIFHLIFQLIYLNLFQLKYFYKVLLSIFNVGLSF